MKQVTKRLLEIEERYRHSFVFLMVLAGFIGGLNGIYFSTWQGTILPAQVLTGLIKLPSDSIIYSVYPSNYSVLNYFGAALLWLTNSEVIASILIAALIGAMTLQALALACFMMINNAFWAVSLATLIGFLGIVGEGIAYPIFLFDTEHASGRMGLTIVAMGLLLIGHERFKSGLFLLGLSVGTHAAWGVFINGVLGISYLCKPRELIGLLKSNRVWGYVAGVTIALGGYFLHRRMHVYTGPVSTDTETAYSIFLNYIQFWDHHRQKFANPHVLRREFGLVAVTLLLSILSLRNFFSTTTNAQKMFFRTLIVGTIVGIIFVFVPSWMDQRLFPVFFISLMTGRFINLSILLATPLVLASVPLWMSRLSPGKSLNPYLISFALAGCLGAVLTLKFDSHVVNPAMILVTLLPLGIWVAPQAWSVLKALRLFFVGNSRLQLASVFVAGLLCIGHLGRVVFSVPKIQKQFEVLSLPQLDEGKLILSSMERYLLQIESRRGVHVPHLDGYLYSGLKLIPQLNEYTTDIYGISLTDSPPKNSHLHGSFFMMKDYQKTWENRSCQQWTHLAQKYSFGLIVVPATVHLNLPRADNDLKWHKYFPHCMQNRATFENESK
jgi:hypothetical protein